MKFKNPSKGVLISTCKRVELKAIRKKETGRIMFWSTRVDGCYLGDTPKTRKLAIQAAENKMKAWADRYT